MPRPSKYQLPKPRSASSSSFRYWLLAAALLAFTGWLAWKLTNPTPARASRPPATESHTNSTPPQVSVVTVQPLSPPIPPSVVSNPPPAQAVTNVPVPAPSPATNAAPPAETAAVFPRPVRDVFEAQFALLSHAISAGSLDGLMGPQTHAALTAFQRQRGLPLTGELDAATRESLILSNAPCATMVVTSNDLARLQPLAATWLGKSRQSALDYETALELVAEKSFAHPNLIRRLNPGIDWTNIAAGTAIQAPGAAYPDPPAKAAFVRIHLTDRSLEAFDAATNLLAHFPCSIAKRVEKRPVGELRVAVIVPNPNYTFDPEVFPESAEARQLGHKLVLPPGPNNPVGVAWIGLDKPGYGIHGTPRPEEVGRTESHGCFRLANWNAEYLVRLVTIGTPVYVIE